MADPERLHWMIAQWLVGVDAARSSGRPSPRCLRAQETSTSTRVIKVLSLRRYFERTPRSLYGWEPILVARRNTCVVPSRSRALRVCVAMLVLCVSACSSGGGEHAAATTTTTTATTTTGTAKRLEMRTSLTCREVVGWQDAAGPGFSVVFNRVALPTGK